MYYADPSGHWCTEKQNVYEKLVKAQGLDPNTIDPDTKLRLMAEAANIVKGKNGANIAANNGALEMPGPILGEQNRLPGPVAESVEAQGRNKSGTPSHSLLPGEGEIGTYKDLLDAGEVGDNITPHHMPSAEYMSQYGVDKKDGLCMNMEMPSPGTGGRHRLTDTYGRNMTDAEKAYYYSLSPRDALAYDIANMRRIYQSQGLYSEIRPKLQEYIKQYKALMPELFDK